MAPCAHLPVPWLHRSSAGSWIKLSKNGSWCRFVGRRKSKFGQRSMPEFLPWTATTFPSRRVQRIKGSPEFGGTYSYDRNLGLIFPQPAMGRDTGLVNRRKVRWVGSPIGARVTRGRSVC